MPVNLFDANFYRAANTDLASINDAQALSHFQNYGLNEGRAFSPFVDLNFYRASNSSLASLNNQQAYNHLQNYGVAEGRRFSQFADLNFYRASNSDLAALSNEQIFEHLQNSGVNEGRRFSQFVDLNYYRASNTDLASFNHSQALQHLEIHGLNEGRQFSVPLDVNYYQSIYSDLASSRLNNRQLLEHFELYGLQEGRTSSPFFNVSYYLTNNSDLRAAGYNNSQAYDHFVRYGFPEGRSSSPFTGGDYAGNGVSGARNIAVSGISTIFRDFVGNTDTNDYYRFSLSNSSNFQLALNGLSADADVQILRLNSDRTTTQVASSSTRSTNAEAININNLAAGSYFAQVNSYSGNTHYNLSISATPAADWTFMVYMAGHNLESFGVKDFLEMANVGSTKNVNIVAQFDRTAEYDFSYGDWTDTRRGIIRQGDTPSVNWGTSIGEANMGDANSLSNFLNWGMTNYQASNYALVLWGHGSGFNVAYDDTGDSLTLNETSSALASLSRNIDLVGADACLMGMTEFAHQIRNNASVLVGSQELTPGTGWNYTTVLSDLTTNSTMNAIDLGTAIVNRYGQHYSSVNNTIQETLSAINLTSLRSSNPNNLSTAISQFATTIMNSATSNDLSQLSTHRTNATSFDQNPNYRDLGNLLSNVISDTSITESIRTAAQTTLNAYRSMIIQNYSVNQRGTGLSIYFSASGYNPSSSYTSSNLAFAADTQWDDFLRWSRW